MSNRRSFLKTVLAGSVFTSLYLMPKQIFAKKTKKMENVLIHHVYFWLKNPKNESDRKAFEAGIEKLRTVENISQSHFGVPAGTENRDVVDHSYSYSLMVIFNSQADQDAYQIDPIHKKFVEECAHLWDKVIVYDSVDL